jgi:hypothetical protein
MVRVPKQLGVQKEVMNEKRFGSIWDAGTPTMRKKNPIPA